ncbi:hypothetical protein ACWGHD_19895 [Streptomyces xanthophaeus]
MTWVQRILESLNWHSLSVEIEWEAVERELGCQLPADFKQLCGMFGRGVFSGFLEISSSFDGEDSLPLGAWRSLRRAVDSDPSIGGYLAPYGVYRPGVPGLIPWASAYSEHQIYWVAEDHPGIEWLIVVQNSEGEWSEFKMTASEFVFRSLMDDGFAFGVAEYGTPYYDLAESS